MGRPTIKKTGPMTGAERQARHYARKRKSINRLRRARRKQAKKGDAAQLRREASRNAPPLPDGMGLRIGDCRTVLADIPDNSIPLILTDPPYGDEAEPLYRWLADFAARVLIPGGSLICLTGQARLDRDMAILGSRLRYWWLRFMIHDTHQRLFGRRVLVGHKPFLHFVKGHLRRLEGRSPLIPDVIHTGGRDKSSHEWGQGDGGVQVFIEHLTDPGESIVDPFAGTGTWGRIAAEMGRRWLGADLAEGGTTTIAAA
jgi:hypothetical protein